MEDRRKYHRVDLDPVDTAEVVLLSEGEEVRRRILNLSYRGIGAEAEKGDTARWAKNSNILITLEIGEDRAEAEATLIFVSETIIGIHFKALEDTSRKVISTYLDPRYLGARLKEVPMAMLKEGGTRLFLGPNNTRMLVSIAKAQGGVTERFEVAYLDIYVQVDEQEQVQTGQLKQDYFVPGPTPVSKEAEWVTMDPQPDPEKLQRVFDLLLYAPLEKELVERLQWKLHAKVESPA